MSLYTCLQDAVGLSQVDCACTAQDRPAGYDTSLSGYYLDDLEHGVPLVYPDSAQDCGTNNVWELLERARQSGVNEFAERMAIALPTAKNIVYREFLSWFGDEKHSSLIPGSPLKSLNGIYFKPRTIRGGKIRVQKISLNVNTLGTYDVSFYKKTDTANPIATYSVPVTNVNQHNEYTLPTPLVLETSDEGDAIEYCVTYARGASVPRNTLFTCGCGSNYRGWMPYIENYYGVSMDNISEFESGFSYTTTATMGLRLFTNMECDGTDFLCSSHLEFNKPDYGRVIAKTIQLLGINKLIHSILSSSQINIYTRLHTDMLMEKMERNSGLINERINWLAYNIPDSLTSCYKCRSGAIMGTIKASV